MEFNKAPDLIYRAAEISDIEQLFTVRFSVTENVLNNRDLVTTNDCEAYLSVHGKGWVCETGKRIVGFSIVSTREKNLWALFVMPDHAGMGIGRKLHKMTLDWYFEQGTERIWLTTAPGTRAEKFYELAGWKQTGVQPNGEIKFELTCDDRKLAAAR